MECTELTPAGGKTQDILAAGRAGARRGRKTKIACHEDVAVAGDGHPGGEQTDSKREHVAWQSSQVSKQLPGRGVLAEIDRLAHELADVDSALAVEGHGRTGVWYRELQVEAA